MARTPFVGTGRSIDGGALATRKQDFNAHVDGTGFRQMAGTVDIAAIEGVAAATVQEALETLNDLITSAGSGFISIGQADGYAQGSYTVGSEGYDSLRDAFEGAIADPRLANGGVILVLAGTYTTSATITIPAGITVMGEMGGTIIVGEMPDVPMFQVTGTSNRIGLNGDSGGGATFTADSGSKIEEVKFFNITLIDNLDGYAAFGSPSITGVPMIRCAVNTRVSCEQVRFIGRLADDNTQATYAAVGYSAGSSSGTHLEMHKCFFDGIEIPVLFSAGGGSNDSLVVNGCRARIASRDSGDGFVHFTQCNARFTNNQVFELPNYNPLEYCFVITATYLNDTSTIIATGNNGYSSYNTAKVVDANASLTYPYSCVLAGNAWGNSQGTGWYVIAGLDFVGENAIDTIISSSISLEDTDVYVIGTYTCTTAGSTQLRLHGGTIRLDVASGTDTGISSNRKFNVQSIDRVRFECRSADTSSLHTVVINNDFNDAEKGIVLVNGCEFIDVGLRVTEVDTLSADESSHVTVSNCHFYQTSSFPNNYSILLPSANVTTLENCRFHGTGYIGGIGDAGSYSQSVADPQIIVRNCTMRGAAITATTPITSATVAYFWINESTAKITIENCTIIPTIPNASMIAGGTYRQAIYLRGASVTVKDSVIGTDAVGMTISSVTYEMPTLFIEPTNSVNVSGCEFTSNFALQIGGSSAFSSGPLGAVIANNSFSATVDYAFTQIDFDIDLNSIPDARPRIVIENNSIHVNASENSYRPIYHTETNASYYDTLGIVQIYANFFDVHVTNNKIYGYAYEPPSQFTEVAALVINNYSSNSNSGARVTKTFISNNNILLETDYSGTEDMDPLSAQTLWIKTPVLHMSDNYISIYLDGSLSDVSIRCMYLENGPAQNHSEGIITGNVFSTKNEAGLTGFLNDEYIYIDNTSGRGMIVNNSFASEIDDVVSGGTEEVDDNTSSENKWRIEQNKNQKCTLVVNGTMGKMSFVDTSDSTPFSLTTGNLIGGNQSSMASFVYSFDNMKDPILYFQDTSAGLEFNWYLPGAAILPYGVKVVDADITFDFDTTAGAESASISVTSNDGGTDTSTPTTITTTAAVPRDVPVTGDHFNTADNELWIKVRITITHGSAVTVALTNFTITYIW